MTGSQATLVSCLRPPDPSAGAEPDVGFAAAAVAWVRETLGGGATDAARARLDAAIPGSAFDALARTFSLAPADEDILLFALAHRIDGAVAALAGAAVGDPRQGYVTAHLVTSMLAAGDPAFAAALFERLAPDAPLRRWALVEVRETHALAAITLAEDAALRLMGLASGRVCGARALPPAPPLPRHEAEARQLVVRLDQGIALIGPPGSGRRALAARIAESAGLRPVLLEPAMLRGSGEGLRAIARDARLDRLAVVLDADAMNPSEPAGDSLPDHRTGPDDRTVIARAVEELGGRIVVLANDPADLPARLWRETVRPLRTGERETLWNLVLDGRVRAGEVAAVAAHFPLGPGEIAALASGITPADPPGTLWRRCRARGSKGLEALAVRVVPRVGWDDLVLPEGVLEELRAIADQVRHRRIVYDVWGFGRRLSSGQGVTALFAGPSGVGKTMAAEVIAGDLGLDLYRVDLSRLVSKYIGETEKNLRRVFDAAEETGACLFLDEADACLGKRSEVRDSHDRHANIEVSYLLQRMESYAGLCLLATNLKNNLDAAFLRRLRFIIDLPLPDQTARYRIWQGAFSPDTPTEGLDYAALARMDISGGSIVVIAVNAAFLAAAEGGPVTMGRIARAARGEYRKHDRVFRATWREAEQ